MSEKVKKLIVLIILVVCAFGSCSGQMWGEIVYDDNEAPETTQTSELEPVEEVEAVTKIYYTVGRTSPVPIVQPFSCNFQGVWYRESEEFRMGPNNCSICVCIDTDVKCNDDECFNEIPEVVETQKENWIPKEKLKLPEINTTVASLIPENHPETHESEASTKYDTTDLLINCCNIGTYMPNCSDTGIDSVMVNPPTGLCRSTIKHCCMLNNQDIYNPIQFKCDPTDEQHTTCCAVCKISHKVTDMPANFKSLKSHCCESAQPLIQHKREKHACNLGYTWNDVTSKCEDIDECKIKNNGCYDESQDCENLDGSYRCIPRQICRVGYELDEDFMECRDYRYQLVTFEPESIQKFEPEPTTEIFDEPIKVPQIECMLGYKYDEETESCVDIDECLDNPCQHYCKNLDGNFQCFCRRGYKANGTYCDDIDECQKSPCSHTCVNVKGSFRCHCPPGMVLAFDRKKCVERILNATCPEQYKIHKTVDDKAFLKCVRTPCETEVAKCKALPKYLTYKSLTLPRNFKISSQGYQIFNIKTKSIKVKVEHKTKVNVEFKGNRVRPASVKDFSIKQEPNRILVSLVRPLSGPQIFTLNINLIKDETKIMESIEIKITVE